MNQDVKLARALDVTNRKMKRAGYERFYARVALAERKRWLGWACIVFLILFIVSFYMSKG
jgi:hypothetical protein